MMAASEADEVFGSLEGGDALRAGCWLCAEVEARAEGEREILSPGARARAPALRFSLTVEKLVRRERCSKMFNFFLKCHLRKS